jgi:two-component SAPR family response regulator
MNRELPLAGRFVLVVEDNYLVAMDEQDWLKAAGARVVGPASNADHAFALLDARKIDSAIIDINLGDGPVYEIADRLAQLGVPFVFATGYDESAISLWFRNRPRLQKPFRADQLVQAIDRLHRESSQEGRSLTGGIQGKRL